MLEHSASGSEGTTNFELTLVGRQLSNWAEHRKQKMPGGMSSQGPDCLTEALWGARQGEENQRQAGVVRKEAVKAVEGEAAGTSRPVYQGGRRER